MPGLLRDNSWPMAASLLLHGAIVAVFVSMAYLSHQQHLPTVQPLPIDAMVVDSKVLHAAQRAKAERAEQEIARARAAADAKAAAEEQARATDEAKAAAVRQQAEEAAKAEASAANQAKAAEVARAIDEARRAADARHALDAKQAAAAKEADAKAEAEARRATEVRRAAEAKQAADAKRAAEAKRAADERSKQLSERELRQQLADEERRNAVESGPLRDRYVTLLRNKIQSAWIKPPAAIAGIDCLVQVAQIPGGEVTGARVTQCNGDASVRQSIENAVYRASPLPDPPDPALFERNIVLRFRPNE
ncbi:MAG: cell envelope integrity protein TolA [Pseudomonadota bacterium]|nr:cell envelope integrity protein TolA [Pseudomonadota bacterium]